MRIRGTGPGQTANIVAEINLQVSGHFAGCPNLPDIGQQTTGQNSDDGAAENIRLFHPQIGYLVHAINAAEKADIACARAVDEQPAHHIAAAVKTARKIEIAADGIKSFFVGAPNARRRRVDIERQTIMRAQAISILAPEKINLAAHISVRRNANPVNRLQLPDIVNRATDYPPPRSRRPKSN